MFETMRETTRIDDALIVVAGKEGDLAFWLNDIRYLEGTETGCRIHILSNENACTLFSVWSLETVMECIQQAVTP